MSPFVLQVTTAPVTTITACFESQQQMQGSSPNPLGIVPPDNVRIIEDDKFAGGGGSAAALHPPLDKQKKKKVCCV
jgi:hypothetical protein